MQLWCVFVKQFVKSVKRLLEEEVDNTGAEIVDGIFDCLSFELHPVTCQYFLRAFIVRFRCFRGTVEVEDCRVGKVVGTLFVDFVHLFVSFFSLIQD